MRDTGDVPFLACQERNWHSQATEGKDEHARKKQIMSAAELILAATDWSENARRAVQRAAYISEQRGAHGLLMHVAKNRVSFRAINSAKSESVRSCFQRIETLAHSIREQTGFTFETQVHAGDVATSIAKAARVTGARLVALGRWTDSALISWTDTPFEESIALRLLDQISSPVLIVKGDPRTPYRRVLVAIDGSESSISHVRQAHALAPDAELIVAHAMDRSLENRERFAEAFDDTLRELRMRQHEEVLNRIHDVIDKCDIPQQQVVKVVEYGHAPKFILDKEQEFLADLVVIGKSQRSRFKRLFFGAVTSQVLARAQCDVLIVPSKGKALLGTSSGATLEK
jgi:nucleotide-binding universal stress UspA family protein